MAKPHRALTQDEQAQVLENPQCRLAAKIAAIAFEEANGGQLLG